jgi:hypothetical protein
MEATRSSETSASNNPTRRHIPEDGDPQCALGCMWALGFRGTRARLNGLGLGSGTGYPDPSKTNFEAPSSKSFPMDQSNARLLHNSRCRLFFALSRERPA